MDKHELEAIDSADDGETLNQALGCGCMTFGILALLAYLCSPVNSPNVRLMIITLTDAVVRILEILSLH